jgi:hypothetical protein
MLAGEVVAAASAAIGRAVLTLARKALWCEASREKGQVWVAALGEQRLVWTTQQDEVVCSISLPLDGLEADVTEGRSCRIALRTSTAGWLPNFPQLQRTPFHSMMAPEVSCSRTGAWRSSAWSWPSC